MSRHWFGLLLVGAWIGAGGVAHAAITVADDPLDIGTAVVGQSTSGSTTMTANVNTLNITVVTHGGDQCGEFSVTQPTSPITINNGNAATVTVKLTPTSPGAKTCVIDIKQSATILQSFTANGQATPPPPPPPKITSQTPTFPDTDVGQTSAAQALTVTNSGGSDLHITSATLTSGDTDFTATLQSPNPLAPIAPNGQASWIVACHPSTFGPRTGTFEIVSDASGANTFDITLACMGRQGVLATDQTATINFTAVPRGTTQTRTFRLSNFGNVDVGTIAITVTPPNAGYTVDLPTLNTLAANGGNATLTVSFKPMSKTDGGPATITFTGTWGSSPTPALSLGVTGNEASYGPMPAQPALDFGRFRYDTHPQQTFQLLNDGNATLAMTAPFTPDLGTGAAEYKVELANGAVTMPPPVILTADDHLTVVVSPQVAHRIGVVSGHIDVTPSVGAPLRVPITGVATAAEVAFPETVDFGVVDLTRPPATQTIAIQNVSDSALDVASLTAVDPSSGGAPSAAFAIALPSTPAHLDPGASLAIPVTYRPTAITAASHPDAVTLNAQLGGALGLGLTIQITGEAMFSEIHGGGGCDAGAGRDGGLVLALAALIAVRWRRRRAARGSIALAAAAAASLAVAPSARADGIGLTVFAPTPATTGEGFALQAPDVGARGRWAASAVVSYASNPLLVESVSGDGGRVTRALVGRSTLLQLGAAYAVLDRLELGARLPLYLQSGDPGAMGQAAHGTALGDLALHAKARLWRGDPGAGALVAGASALVMLPTASKDQFTGSDRPEARLLLLGSFTPGALGSRVALAVNAGAVLRATSSYYNIEQRSGLAWGAGASVRIVPALWATAELFGELMPSARHPMPVPGVMPPPVALSQAEGLAGVSFRPEPRISVGLALGRGLTSAPGTPELRGVLSLSVVPGAASPDQPPRPHVAPVPDADSDGDGIPDASDRCPDQPEDRDGFQDADGCPDPDNDGDGIPDASDRCPNQPETVNGYQDDDGCPDSLPAADPAAATRAAEASFAKGRDRMAQKQYAEACAAFEQSQRLDPQFGTQFNLAICDEKLGKLATAWNLYRELARSDSNPARRARAGQVAAALAPRIPKLRLVLSKRPDGVQVLLNGVDASALIGIEAPVDAGRYTVTASAAGHRPWQTTVEAQDGRVVTVVIDLKPVP